MCVDSLSPEEPDDVLGSDEDFEPNVKAAKRKQGPALEATVSINASSLNSGNKREPCAICILAVCE